jgi:hypothetical protein
MTADMSPLRDTFEPTNIVQDTYERKRITPVSGIFVKEGSNNQGVSSVGMRLCLRS